MLKDIKESLIKDAKKEGESALVAAEAQLEEDLTKVKADGEQKVDLAQSEAKKMMEGERRERISWANLEAKRIRAEAMEDASNAAFDTVIERVKRYAGSKAYAQSMKMKIIQAMGEVGGRCIVHVKRGEKRLLTVPGADMRDDADVLGGAIIESKNGRMRIDYSLESLLSVQKDTIRKEIYKRLF